MIPLEFKSSSIKFLILISIAHTIIALTSDSISASNDFDILGASQFKNNPSFDEEYKLFLEELENGTAKSNGRSRQKRYVYLNTETNLDVGYLVVIPVTVVIPSMSNLFNVWRRKRSLDNFNVTSISDEPNPFLQAQVDRISSYYDLMNVPEKACQLRATCELSAEPSSYFPISDIILGKIRDPLVAKHRIDGNTSVKPSLLQLYTEAADEGNSFGKGKCETKYAKSCKYPIDTLLNMPVMKFWRKVQSKLQLKFDDNHEGST